MKFFLLFALFTTSLTAQSNISGIDLRNDKKIKFILNKNKPTVYYFLSAWCPCSQGSFDHLNELQKKYRAFNFVAFHSSIKIPKKDALSYFAKFKIDFPIISDPELVYADRFKALKTPHIFVFDKNENLVYQGAATNSRDPKKASKFYLKDALESLSLGKQIKIQYTKTLGCYIQRS